RQGDRATIRGLEDVVGCKHQHASLSLSLYRKRQVHSHLVTVEVCVERGANERVELDCLTFNELRLEGLDAQAVQGRCAVEQHGTLTDDLFEHVPNLRAATLNRALSGLDVLRVTEVHQALDHERLEQLESHLLG